MGARSLLERAFFADWPRLAEGSATVVGLSGGGDSMALLALVHQYLTETGVPQAVYPVHLDHGLRPGSATDADWIQTYVQERFGRTVEVIPLTVVPDRGESVEMAARRARRAALETARRERGARFIALAHQQDDQAETVLMRIAAGTGVVGLAAMSERHGAIVRPLLSVPRSALRAYLARRGIRWLEDPSNLDRAMLRNRIRHQILPELRESVNPGVVEALCRLADQAGIWRDWLEAALTEYLGRTELRLDRIPLRIPPDWRQVPPPVQAYLLQQFAECHALRLQAVHLRPVLEGRAAEWPGGLVARPEAGGGLVIGPARAVDPTPLPPDGGGRMVWHAGRISWPGGFLWVGEDPPARDRRLFYSVLLKPAAASWAIRRWRAGDRLMPIGLGGHKKVQDVFVDRKIPRDLRRIWPIVVDGEDRVLSVVGLADDVAARADGTPVRVAFLPDEAGQPRPDPAI